jgi:tRNA1(Val) A37 N6-methylase TrmN6
VRQPSNGFRAGLDAVVLAASVPARAGEQVLELGSGCGTASLCLAARLPDCDVTGLEIDEDLVGMASGNADMNALADRLRFVAGDVFAPPRNLRRAFDHVFANPPFHHPSDPASTDILRKRSTHDGLALQAWLEAGLKRVRPGGTVTMIVRTDRLAEVFEGQGAQGTALLPLWARQGEPSKRIIVQIRKGSRERLRLLPGLVLHEKDGRYTQAADSVLRDGSALSLAADANAG